tara:strand:- start:1146 stop:1460 length:315 start_codon:yes stop_codon:yes gene_type:complete
MISKCYEARAIIHFIKDDEKYYIKINALDYKKFKENRKILLNLIKKYENIKGVFGYNFESVPITPYLGQVEYRGSKEYYEAHHRANLKIKLNNKLMRQLSNNYS